MALFKNRTKLDEKKFFQSLVLGFVAVQLISLVISYLFPDMQLIKGGYILFLFLFTILITTTFTLGKKIGELNLKRDGPFILFVFLSVIALFILIPKIVPEIFSSFSIELGRIFEDSINSIIKIGSSVI